MKIYIAGPMTGIKDWNFPAFFAAEETLKRLGHEPINPAHNDGDTVEKALLSAGSPDKPNFTWASYMQRDLPHVLGCDALCLLPGWQDSKGAQLEVTVAKAIGLPLLILDGDVLKPRVQAIGLSGYARSGKDTVGEFLIANHGFKRVSFADPMREALELLNPSIEFHGYWTNLQTALGAVGWEQLKSESSEIRPLLQRFGTEVGREMFGQNFWVDLAISRIPDGSKVVFTDVRFPNEADAVSVLGGEVWRIERPGTKAANAHISETALDSYGFDLIIWNDADLSHLYATVEAQMEIKK